jgi:hypothetical protein
MKPNALIWHFDRPSLHLRRHGVERFFRGVYDARDARRAFRRARLRTHRALARNLARASARLLADAPHCLSLGVLIFLSRLPPAAIA